MTLIWFLPLLLITACKNRESANIPDVSDIDVDVEITRFEDILLSDTTLEAARLDSIREKYPAFSTIFFNHIMPKEDELIVTTDPELQLQQIESWIRQPKIQWLYDTVRQIYPDLEPVEQELESAFRFAQYYFPEKEVPKIYTTLSDFGYFPFIYAEDSLRDGIGISLEMFLGEDFPYLVHTGLNNAFSDYLTRSYNKEHITRRVLDVWVDDLAGPPPGDRLLDIMIHNGKKLFIIESLMPQVHDSVIIDYSLPKLEWVRSNERNIWTIFTTENLLYETSLNKIQKLIGPSPSSPGMPRESPGNTGSWLGWQIVRTYMQKHPDVTLQELLSISDAQKILDDSGYKPPR